MVMALQAEVMKNLAKRSRDRTTSPRLRVRKATQMSRPSGEWQWGTLRGLAKFRSGGTPDKREAAFWGGEIPWITAKDMKSLELKDSIDHITERGAAKVRGVGAGAILILVRGMALHKDIPIGLATRSLTFNQDVKALIPNTELIPKFLLYYLLSKKNDLLSNVESAGHGTGRLNTELLQSLRAPIPPLSEQRRIVDVLTTWDRAIDVATLSAHGASRSLEGLLARLLDRCADQRQWRMHKLTRAKLSQLFNERVEFGDVNHRLLSVTGSAGVIDREKVERRDTSSEDKSRYKLVMPGDIAYNTMRMWQGVSGLSSLSGIVSPAYTVVTPSLNRIDPQFAAYLFKSPRMIHRFLQYSQGLVDDTLNLKYPQFAEIEIAVPPLDEQSKAVAALDAASAEIRIRRCEIEVLRRQRDALASELLTGRLRVSESEHLSAAAG